MASLRLAALALAILATALAAGFFYAFHAVVMPGLAASDPGVAIHAMRAVNASVRNATFAFGFFGPLAFGALAAVLCAASPQRGAAVLAGAGWAVYVAGVYAVTAAINVPLNEALAAANPVAEPAAALWRRFAEPWGVWNAVRAVAALLALAGFVGAFAMCWAGRR